ncbi:hypothetical protein CQW23_25056 [Capsicum baccatum]|uniref:Disease resistance protein At4g27190-like leucine-rich repeats domain-containing protein n=1 Tax=Capsicum baccatum TaxID=33114 RepID=A0A2G2VWJ6_CAPBA|nr:hypothetical protein CQW23_25056 [Capsicum baccatum]
MSELSVISLSGYDQESILAFPSSIQRLSNLRTLCLNNLRLNEMTITRELVSLEILSIRDSYLEELPVEVGNLVNLIMLEYWNTRYRKRMRISPGVLSRPVRLEELHVVGVEQCSYSTLRELESLPRLTALSFTYSRDVIYSNLGLSSKLTRYALAVGGGNIEDTIMATYNKIIALKVSESTPLGDWIRLLLRNSEFVSSRAKGSKNVLAELKNVKDLRLAYCDSLDIHCQNNIPFPQLERLKVSESDHLRHLFCLSLVCPDDEEEGISRRTHMRPDVIKFPNLYRLELGNLGCFTHFCRDTVKGVEFSLLREMQFGALPEFQNFWPTDNNAITYSNTLFNEKVSCPNLEVLFISSADSITALCSHQLPTAYFNKLETLKVDSCEKLRNLMSPSVARGLLNLRIQGINQCQLMEEVIGEEEREGEEIMCNEPLFPRLEDLNLYNLPKLGHFILTKHALEFPSLKELDISSCPKMKTFIQQEGSIGNSLSTSSKETVSTLNLESAKNDDELKVVDLNKAMFNSKSLLNLRKLKIEYCPLMEEVITEEEQQGEEIMTNEPLFPRLEELILYKLPNMGHFFLTKHALGVSFLRAVKIRKCPEMKMFVQQGYVSTPSLENVNSDDEVKVDDVNEWIHRRFISKEEGGSESEASIE